jgi:choline dehydrogenase-like flavoprotein
MLSRQVPDYLVIGGGTAGCVVASRLSERPDVTVTLIEWGPDDAHEPRAQSIRRWDEMLEGDYDLDYRSVPQERGNSDIRMARLRILGGCSTANTMITWRPLRSDLEEWMALGAQGWDAETVWPYYDRIPGPITPIPPEDRNSAIEDVVDAAARAMSIPRVERWNDQKVQVGAGFFEIGYEPRTNQRSSSSHSYLRQAQSRINLQVVTEARALRIVLDEERAVGVRVLHGDGAEETLRAGREVIVCCGAIDSPRLLQLSGIGPKQVLEDAGIKCLLDAPGVGENLQDHAEGIVVWETRGPRSSVSATGWDAGFIVNASGEDDKPEISTHIPLTTWGVHVEHAGVNLPEYNVSLAPNVCKPRSRGRLWIIDDDPLRPPAIDYRYFTDPDGYDERILVEGIRRARAVAREEPFRSALVREVFPGPEIVADEDISRLARATHQTVYHVCGTCKIGADDDPMAVLDPELRVRGLSGLRVVDASVFPTITALNPVGTVLSVAERGADLILAEYDRGTTDAPIVVP